MTQVLSLHLCMVASNISTTSTSISQEVTMHGANIVVVHILIYTFTDVASSN
jgi:hypothetical protein